MTWWVVPLIQAAMGVGRAVYENQAGDPYTGRKAALGEQAGSARRESRRDVLSPMTANIRNVAANRSFGAQSGNVAAGRGSSTLTPQLQNISQGAGMAENEAIRYAANRRMGLMDKAGGYETEIAGLGDQWKALKHANVMSALSGGIQQAATSAAGNLAGDATPDYDPMANLTDDQRRILQQYQAYEMPN